MTQSTAAAYLRSKEWSLGNGQCPECGGVHQGWFPHPNFLTADKIGHKPDCQLAESLRSLGESPLMLGQFKSEIEYEGYFRDDGLYDIRPITPEQRAERKQSIEKISRELMSRIFKSATLPIA